MRDYFQIISLSPDEQGCQFDLICRTSLIGSKDAKKKQTQQKTTTSPIVRNSAAL